jgi:hypothetical protein
MGRGITDAIGDKSRHMWENTKNHMVKGVRAGAAIGAALGVVGLFLFTSVASGGLGAILGGMLFAGIGGGFLGSVSGLGIGGAFGALKGALTRTRPDGDHIVQEAVAEGQSKLPMPEQQQGQVVSAPAQGQMPAAAVADLREMTRTLNEIKANQGAATQGAASPVSWRDRVQTQQPAVAPQR